MSPRRLTALVLTTALLTLGGATPWLLAQTDKGERSANADPLPTGAVARLGTLRFRHGGDVYFVACLPKGQLLTAGYDGTARLWDLATGKETRKFTLPATPPADTTRLGILTSSSVSSSLPVSVSADGSILTAAEGRESIRLWNLGSGKELEPIKDVKGGVASLALSPDGKTVAGVGADGSVTAWQVGTGKEVRKFHEVAPPAPAAGGVAGFASRVSSLSPPSVAYSPDGKWLAAVTTAVDEDGVRLATTTTLKVWDAVTGKEVNSLRWPRASTAQSIFAFSPDGSRLAWAGTDGIIHVEEATGKPIRYFKADLASRFVFSADGKTLLATALASEKIRRWETETGKELEPIARPQEKSLSMLSLSPDGKLLACKDGHGVFLLDLATGKALHPAAGHATGVQAVQFSSDGKALTTLGSDGAIFTWDPATAKGEARALVRAPSRSAGRVLSPDGKTLAYGDILNSGVTLADAATGKALRTITPAGDVLRGGFGGFRGGVDIDRGAPPFVFTPDGTGLAVSEPYSRTVKLYEVATGKEVRSFGEPAVPAGGRISALGGGLPMAFSADGKFLAARTAPDSCGVYEVSTGHLIRKLPVEPTQPIANISISPDARTAALDTGEGLVTLFEVLTGKERASLGKRVEAPPQPVAPTRRTVATVTAPALAWSPDGRLLARPAGSSVQVWDAVGGRELGKLAGHEGDVLAAAFSPDGKRLATGSLDTTVLVWDVAALRKGLKAGAELTDAQAEEHWAALISDDAAKAFAAMTALASAPGQAVSVLEKRLKPVAPPDPKVVAQWIEDLKNEEFKVRDKAHKELQKLGPLAAPALRKALDAKPAPELDVRVRLEALLDEAKSPGDLPAEALRSVRAVEVLERLGTPEARKVLQALGKGTPGAPMTGAALEALQRLQP